MHTEELISRHHYILENFHSSGKKSGANKEISNAFWSIDMDFCLQPCLFILFFWIVLQIKWFQITHSIEMQSHKVVEKIIYVKSMGELTQRAFQALSRSKNKKKYHNINKTQATIGKIHISGRFSNWQPFKTLRNWLLAGYKVPWKPNQLFQLSQRKMKEKKTFYWKSLTILRICWQFPESILLQLTLPFIFDIQFEKFSSLFKCICCNIWTLTALKHDYLHRFSNVIAFLCVKNQLANTG